LDLVADLRSKSDVFLVAALNQDVQTFDNMVAALHFHMYQPVILANSGEFWRVRWVDGASSSA
jgi:hypothetical protein